MPLSLSTSEDAKFIIMKITGDINRRIAIEYDLEAHKLGNELGINCYLMDLTESRNTDTVLDSYSFAYKDVNVEEIDKTAIVALLVAQDDHSHDFIETVSKNAGLNVQLFRDRTLAENYLTSTVDSKT